MRLLTQLQTPLQLPMPVVTVGTFDGIHLGHWAILDRVIREAGQRKGTATVITFDRHPRSVIAPESAPPLLLSREEKLRALGETGIDVLVELAFTLEFSKTRPEEFIEEVIVDRIHAVSVVVGCDHGFGKGRSGDISTWRALGSRLGFEVIEVPPFRLDGSVVSSTRLRGLITAGRMEKAGTLLGRPYRLLGEVVGGQGRGREIGFPTANLKPSAPEKLLPADGVYLVRVEVEGGGRHGVANIGRRPTFGAADRSVEVHVLDFEGDLYGKKLELEFLARLRDERKFKGSEELAAQIRRDVEAAKAHITEALDTWEKEVYRHKPVSPGAIQEVPGSSSMTEVDLAADKTREG